jgi:hypothetical protein
MRQLVIGWGLIGMTLAAPDAPTGDAYPYQLPARCRVRFRSSRCANTCCSVASTGRP